jgi:dTDP-4-dehydrorhamnose 3,5-epimerase
VEISPLRIEGAWSLTPRQFPDERGLFTEYFVSSELESVIGHRLDLHQANLSVSAAGVVRGIHFAQVPPSQAKYVTCPSGAVLDVVVDLRTGSPTYGQWDSVQLDDVDRRALYLSEGLGHAFMALAEGSVVTYLCSAPYAPAREHGITPAEPDLAIDWPTTGRDGRPLEPLLSPKDTAAPTLAEAAAAGLLPTYDDAVGYVRSLGSAGGSATSEAAS